MQINQQAFGKTLAARQIELYTLTNSQGMSVSITNYGGTICTLKTPDRNGNIANVVLGYDTLEEYLQDTNYFGCLVGRCANRIAHGTFNLDRKTYALKKNAGRHHLHGGDCGFNKRTWISWPKETNTELQLRLQYLSPDMEEGYPGNLEVIVVYTLMESNALKIEYRAETDRPTIVNLTHHSYFNLAGPAATNCLNHEVLIQADSFLPVDKDIIPTGEIRVVRDTPMDFLAPQNIGSRIYQPDEQLLLAGGYDQNWVVKTDCWRENTPAASAYDPISGRFMEVFTDQPGIQFYTGNHLNVFYPDKKSRRYGRYAGFCLETQKFPDAPHQATFPSIALLKGEVYSHTTIYKFSIH